MSIDGHWVGFFLQDLVRRPGINLADVPENRFEIEAWFETDGDVVTGKMLDLETDREFAYSEWLAGMHDGLPKLKRIERFRYLAKYPNATFRVSGCPDSSIAGVIDGDSINFSKTYCGPRECAIRNGRVESVIRHLGPTVYYFGSLSADGKTLSGSFEAVRWTEEKTHVKGTGDFILVKQDDVEAE